MAVESRVTQEEIKKEPEKPIDREKVRGAHEQRRAGGAGVDGTGEGPGARAPHLAPGPLLLSADVPAAAARVHHQQRPPPPHGRVLPRQRAVQRAADLHLVSGRRAPGRRGGPRGGRLALGPAGAALAEAAPALRWREVAATGCRRASGTVDVRWLDLRGPWSNKRCWGHGAVLSRGVGIFSAFPRDREPLVPRHQQNPRDRGFLMACRGKASAVCPAPDRALRACTFPAPRPARCAYPPGLAAL